ncbi:hypothetical protein EDEG_03617 [Edhazardia aedis USNM 41457]|uniref:aspartyl aminopeptidase n=1 Tax=Edhazardia aedis (strain USNM 41457) TaxID=1003232 RepID=J9DH34_EDHAE|nr:hypothetical protein EDEG_03617 [Edhazardia aedis USNM 41457]|eukprot:EJW01915.1 hypothetical protein EDEG_03617 [Edhazardia aedis USNM 41457]
MERTAIQEYLDFLNNSPTPFHAILESTKILEYFGFQRIGLQNFKPSPGRFYIKLNKTFLIAFTIPNGYSTNSNSEDNRENQSNGEFPLKIVATHCDSPVLKIKQNGFIDSTNTVRLQPYGGGLWHTWFDRPLGIAGQIITKTLKSKIITLSEPLVVIPSLAIHLNNADVYKNGFTYNKEDHLNAVCGSYNSSIKTENKDVKKTTETQSPINVLKNMIDPEFDSLLSHDLSIFDISGASLGGSNKDLIFSARQDNLLSTFFAIKGLIADDQMNSKSINVVAVFDHEEIGSQTITGARSSLFANFISKVNFNLNKSLIVSCDVAHATNPNYLNKYESKNSPLLGLGLVVKYSTKYATNNYTASVIKYLCEKNQDFILRNDLIGGSTIGPMLVSKTGIQGVDVGVPIMAMHSVKELSSVHDCLVFLEFVQEFFKNNSWCSN